MSCTVNFKFSRTSKNKEIFTYKTFGIIVECRRKMNTHSEKPMREIIIFNLQCTQKSRTCVILRVNLTNILNCTRADKTNATTARQPLNVSFCNGFLTPTFANNGYKMTSNTTRNINPKNGISICIWSGLIVQPKLGNRPSIRVACNVHREPYTNSTQTDKSLTIDTTTDYTMYTMSINCILEDFVLGLKENHQKKKKCKNMQT